MSSEDPKVSVIIPTLNDIEYIEESIESVFNQTFDDFEIVVVDGGSTDGTQDFINSISDQRITLIESGGIVESLNEGIRETSGKYIARVDADSFSYPERLEKQVSYLEHNSEVAAVGTAARRIDPTTGQKRIVRMPENHSDIIEKLRDASPIVHPSVMIRRSPLVSVGGYRPYHWEDYELWTRLAEYRLANIPEVLVDVYQRRDSIQGNTSDFKSIVENTRCGLLAIQRGPYGRLEKKRLYLIQLLSAVKKYIYKRLYKDTDR